MYVSNIGKTDKLQFVDYYSIGTHKYEVRGVIGDNYDMSNAAEITLECKMAMIADTETCVWHVLRHKRGVEPIVSVSTTHDVVYQHYAGRRLPMAEIAYYEDERYSFEYAFLDRTGAIAMGRRKSLWAGSGAWIPQKPTRRDRSGSGRSRRRRA